MKIEKGILVPLGYGKYFRSDSIVGLEPVEEGRGPGKRTKVYIEHLATPLIASRSEGAILRDLVGMPQEVMRAQEQHEVLRDMLDTISSNNSPLPLMVTMTPFGYMAPRSKGMGILQRYMECLH